MPYSADRANISPSHSTLSPTSSPLIRGSLDPAHKSKTSERQGWRYIQCSSVKDELRVRSNFLHGKPPYSCPFTCEQVLLPPRPAAIYANLLKVEAHVLAKNDAESLQEAQLISILKDAMVERCEKLAMKAQLSSPQMRSNIVEAPSDFKLRRLERWWETMEASGKTKHSSNRQGERDALLIVVTKSCLWTFPPIRC